MSNQHPEFQSLGGVTPPDVPIPPPQQPGHNPPPNYGQQPAYGQQLSYGQAHQGYHPVAPNFAQVPLKPARPGIATGASVLGIITGSLGIAAPPLIPNMSVTTQGITETFYISFGYLLIYILSSLGVVAGLLVGSIMFLKGHGYKTLLISTCAQLVVVAWWYIFLIMTVNDWSSDLPSTRAPFPSVSASFASIVASIFTPVALLGLGLGISILVCLLNPASKQWRDLNARPR